MMRKAQIQVTFNWIYILIAGAVILLFFVGLVVKQKASAEEHLAIDVVRVMDSIFTGADVADQTKTFIDTSGLADYTLYFSCEESVGRYGIKGTSAEVQNEVDSFFSPEEIKTPQMILWSLPYKLPFKVADFLFVSSINTKYIVIGDGSFAREFINQTADSFNIQEVTSLEEIEPGKNFHLRVVDFSGAAISSMVPSSLQDLEDSQVSAVKFTSANLISFYQKSGASWELLNPEPLPIISLPGERDAAKYAAVFSGNDQIYWCNMQKAFKRLERVAGLYEKKREEMEEHYAGPTGECLNNLRKEGYEKNLASELGSYQNVVGTCNLPGMSPLLCSDLITIAQRVKEVNQNLRLNCITLY